MFKVAFSIWNERIAPVFDVASRVYVAKIESGRIINEARHLLPEGLPSQKALRLKQLGVEVLVCGAISRPMEATIISYNIKVVPFVTGDLSEVIQGWLSGDLERTDFIMPGCVGRGRRRGWSGDAAFKEVKDMSARKRDNSGAGRGLGSGGGRGQGRGGGRDQGQGTGQGRGRMGGPFAAGPMGDCVCPKCGYKQPHERGVPCYQMQCPQCGVSLTR